MTDDELDLDVSVRSSHVSAKKIVDLVACDPEPLTRLIERLLVEGLVASETKRCLHERQVS